MSARIVCPVFKRRMHWVASLHASKLRGCAASVALADEDEPSESQSPSDRRGSIAGCY